ncbi:hypothetical protein DB88DRAFT_484537 [Papiliotrema laurentii]|uniref:Uncharacterized protein n=1 Tax=Papiliotrema laurentii TaxID=5418 RepID=A0AAD9L6R9_PAPLA|nr:hypothetical protein DB88DRAFT_484537 [Papiliotrema laurentii]
MAFALHPLLSTYPGASFFPNGNMTGPHLAARSGGNNPGYWGYIPWETPQPPQWGPPPAVQAMMEGRGTGVYGLTMQGPGGAPFNYGWPKYGPMPLKPELGGFVGKLNPFGRSYPYGYYKTEY